MRFWRRLRCKAMLVSVCADDGWEVTHTKGRGSGVRGQLPALTRQVKKSKDYTNNADPTLWKGRYWLRYVSWIRYIILILLNTLYCSIGCRLCTATVLNKHFVLIHNNTLTLSCKSGKKKKRKKGGKEIKYIVVARLHILHTDIGM